MEELLAQIEAEIELMRQTLSVVRILKPIQRQQDQCMTLIRQHVENLNGIVSVEKSGPVAVTADETTGEATG